MSASLVGSEMCIRDRCKGQQKDRKQCKLRFPIRFVSFRFEAALNAHKAPVSYTHLTLPTICSV
eukprot:8009162-Alexandrium_andersonii.AAC.1